MSNEDARKVFRRVRLAIATIVVVATTSHVHAQDAKIGYIQWRESNLPGFLDGIATLFPVNTFEKVTLTNSIGDHGLDAVVNEMDAIVNDMTSRGIDRIMIAASSAETGPFIEGSAGSLGGVHSDVRYPNVIFSADRQGTASVDNAQNWYRAGIDFVTGKVLGAPVLLPDVRGVIPRPQFILATDNSPAVDQANTPFTARATTAGYEVVNVDLGWNEATNTFDSFSNLGSVIALATPNSKVGLSLSAAPSNDDTQPLVRWVKMSELGLVDANVFDPSNQNVQYMGLNYDPFFGDFDNPGSLPVDVQYGVGPAPVLVSDPGGVNEILRGLGYPNDRFAARAYDDEQFGGSGLVTAASFAWLATDGNRNLDPRHLLDENRQLVEFYVDDGVIPAGATWDEFETENLRINPRWTEIKREQNESPLYGNLEHPFDASDVGPRFDRRDEKTAQQFLTGDADNLSSVSVRLQRVGSPTGEVALEIWDDNGSGQPGSRISTVGTFQVSSLSTTTAEVLDFDALVTGLDPNSPYFLVLNNDGTNITSPDNSYRFGVRGHVDDEQAEGTAGAIKLQATDPSGNWHILDDPNFFGCNPNNGHCASYLHLSVESVPIVGDFSYSGTLDTMDIDMLSLQLRSAPSDRNYDLNNDGVLTQADREAWVHDLANTYFGDSNLDGEFNSGDLTKIFQAGEYEDNIVLNSTWSEGDWNGDGDFESGDLVLAFQDGGYEKGPRMAVNAVPEPSSVALCGLAAVAMLSLRKRV